MSVLFLPRTADGLMKCQLTCIRAICIWVLWLLPQPVCAGGPATVAGTSFFDPGLKGTPLTWNQGVVSYYTDRGNLSPVLPAASVDAFVADAFSRWTSIPTAAVSVARAGQLAEDVSGANVNSAGGRSRFPLTSCLPPRPFRSPLSTMPTAP